MKPNCHGIYFKRNLYALFNYWCTDLNDGSHPKKYLDMKMFSLVHSVLEHTAQGSLVESAREDYQGRASTAGAPALQGALSEGTRILRISSKSNHELFH